MYQICIYQNLEQKAKELQKDRGILKQSNEMLLKRIDKQLVSESVVSLHIKLNFGKFYPPIPFVFIKGAVKLWYFRFQTWLCQNAFKEIFLIDKVI